MGYSLRTLNRIDYCRRTARCNTTKGEAIRSNGFDNRLQVKDTPVEVAASRITLRRPRPAAVIKDHAPAPLNQRTDVGRTIIHVGVQVNVSEDPRRKYDGPPLAQRSVGDAHPIARLRVLDAWLHHSPPPSITAHTRTGSPTPFSARSPRSSNRTPALVRASERTVSDTSTSPGTDSPLIREAMLTAPP